MKHKLLSQLKMNFIESATDWIRLQKFRHTAEPHAAPLPQDSLKTKRAKNHIPKIRSTVFSST